MTDVRSSVPPLRYRLLVRVLAPVLLVHLAIRVVRDGGLRYARERLGHGSTTAPSDGDARPWIHAASVGEVMTVLPLVEGLLTRPGITSVLVTTNTPTGAEVLGRHGPPGVRHRYLPIDWPGATRRFLARERPTSGWFVETEIWPWLYARAGARDLPLAIINARLSRRTTRHADGLLGPVYRQALAGVDILARSDADADAYRTLGATRTRVVGDLKYASGTPAASARSAIPMPLIDQAYVLAASTHEDEEKRLADAWCRRRPDGLLVIVPRHPARGAAIARELPDCRRRALGEEPAPDARLHLADTLGELDAWYAHARGVFVGGSLIARGGHNLLEPARHARPIVVGPHTGNFTDVVARLRQGRALAVVEDADAVVRFLDRALDGDAELTLAGERARRVATDTGDIVARYLGEPGFG